MLEGSSAVLERAGRPMQLARRPVCALSRRPTAVQPHRPPFGRLLCTGTPPPPPPPPPASRLKQFWDWTLQQRPHWRENRTEAAVIFCVFGVTGSTSVAFVRPALKHTIGLEGKHKPALALALAVALAPAPAPTLALAPALALALALARRVRLRPALHIQPWP